MAGAKKDGAIVVDGVEVHVAADRMADIDVVEAIADVNAPELDEMGVLRACIHLFRATFGDEYRRIKDELRERNGGELSAEQMGNFFNRHVEAMNSKNS